MPARRVLVPMAQEWNVFSDRLHGIALGLNTTIRNCPGPERTGFATLVFFAGPRKCGALGIGKVCRLCAKFPAFRGYAVVVLSFFHGNTRLNSTTHTHEFAVHESAPLIDRHSDENDSSGVRTQNVPSPLRR